MGGLIRGCWTVRHGKAEYYGVQESLLFVVLITFQLSSSVLIRMLMHCLQRTKAHCHFNAFWNSLEVMSAANCTCTLCLTCADSTYCAPAARPICTSKPGLPPHAHN